MALAVLSIDLVAKMAKFEADMGKAARASQKTADQISSAFSVIKGAAGGLAAGFSVGALVAFTKATIDSIDALNDVADATGASVENISALEDVAARTGTTLDTVSTALVKFNGVLKDAKPGSDAESALKALGLSYKELQTLDPAEALRRTAVALSGFADDGNKARITQELFGKSLKEVAPYMKDLGEQTSLVAKVTKQQADEAEKLNKELFAMQKNVQDAARYLSQDFVTGINKAAKAFRESGLLGAIQTLLTGDDQHKNNVALTEYTDKLLTAENALSKARASGMDSRGIAARQKYVDDLKEQIQLTLGYRKMLAAEDVPEQVKPSVKAIPEKAKPAAAARQSEAERYIESLQKQLEKTKELSVAEQVMLDISKGRLGKVSAGQQAALLDIAKQIDGVKALTEAEKTRDEARKQSAKYFESMAQEQDAIEKSNAALAQSVETIGLTKEAVDALTLARMDAIIAQEREIVASASMAGASIEEIKLMEHKIELLQKQRNLTARGQIAQGMADTVAEQEAASKEYAKTLETDMKGAFSAAFRDTKDPLGAFGDALANVIYSRAATALADSFASSMSSGGGSGGGFMSSLASLFSFDGGGSTGNGSRSGGLDGKGGFMAMLHPKETVIDHTKGQTSGSVVVNQSFTVGDVASVSMVRQAVANSQRQMAAALNRTSNYGGAV